MNWPGATHGLLRIIAAFILIPHGYQKLFGIGERGPSGDVRSLVAATIEIVFGTLILLGFQTRWAAFLCSGLMAFAYWLVHGPRAFLPYVNGGEPAVLLCFIFLFLWANGPGDWSLDSVLAKRRKSS
jgi:putative oxidoreductase